MNKLFRFACAVALVCALAAPAFTGDIHTSGAAPTPTPTPTADPQPGGGTNSATGQTEGEETNITLEAVLLTLESLLRLL